MILKDALSKGIEILKNANIETPAVEAGVILCNALNKDKVFLYSHNDYELNDRQLEIFFEGIEKRVQHIPVQYITGHQEFMSLDFIVNENVLIPRQDTEILVETIISYKKRLQKESIKILDIGTGSGCIAVSLAYLIKDSLVTAVDISEKALEVARLNAHKASVEDRILFLQSGLFDRVEQASFDIIVSNPPYITSTDILDLQPEVKDYEPIMALDGGRDGLDFYREIIIKAVDFLTVDGVLAFEVGYNQARSVVELMKQNYHKIKIIKDLSGIERVVAGQLNM